MSGRVSWLPSFLQAAGCGCARSPLGCPGLGLLAEGPSVPQACWRLLAPRLGLCCHPKTPDAAWWRCLYFVERQKMECLWKTIHVEEMSGQHIPGGWEQPASQSLLEHTLLPENSRLQPPSSTSSTNKGL